MAYIHSKRSGFTVPELIISMALLLILVGVSYNFYILTKDTYRYVFEQGRMQAKGIFILERIARGMDANSVDGTLRGIHTAQDIAVPSHGNSSSQIQFSDQDNNTLIFYVLNNEVRYADDVGNDIRVDTDLTSDSDVQSLTFNRPADANSNLVEIGIVLQDTVAGKLINVVLSTTVRLRNM